MLDARSLQTSRACQPLVCCALLVGAAAPAWATEWRSLQAFEQWNLQEGAAPKGDRFRIVTSDVNHGGTALAYRCDRRGKDSIVLLRAKADRLTDAGADAIDVPYEAGNRAASVVMRNSHGVLYVSRGSAPYRQMFQDLMRNSLMTFTIDGYRRLFSVSGFTIAAAKLQARCRHH